MSRANVKLCKAGVSSEVEGVALQVGDKHSSFGVGVGKPGGGD